MNICRYSDAKFRAQAVNSKPPVPMSSQYYGADLSRLGAGLQYRLGRLLPSASSLSTVAFMFFARHNHRPA